VEVTLDKREQIGIAACVVGMPCGRPSYVLSVPFRSNSTDNGAESA
jgi:hypothetical protein